MVEPSILIIDDFPIWLRLLRRLLLAEGYAVHTAETCAEGLKLAGEVRPGCILLDFHLPDGDAVSFCAALRGNSSTRDIPVIIISGDQEMRMTALGTCRAAAFLEKGSRWVREVPKTLAVVLAGARPAGRTL